MTGGPRTVTGRTTEERPKREAGTKFENVSTLLEDVTVVSSSADRFWGCRT